MKLYDARFEDYIEINKTCNLHPKMNILYNNFPSDIQKLRNIIFYGPCGVGKYTQALLSIKKYSPSELKYEKKISITFNKNVYYFKISDIHFEIDMSLLGCQSKMLWNEFYYQVLDIISTKNNNIGFIVCKNFHEIHNELLETFYSYMQTLYLQTLKLKFILLTEELSFIPDNILNNCKIIPISRPTRTQYNKILKNKLSSEFKLHEITNIKNIHSSITQLMNPHFIICNKIIENMINFNELKFGIFRNMLYELLIYNQDITDCIWYILNFFIKEKKINDGDLSDILIRTFVFLQYYNNNYRPIYHLENYIFYLISKIHHL